MADFTKLLDKLYGISGVHTADPGPEDYLLVSRAFHHADAEVRERAIFIGALRWMDRTMLGYTFAAFKLEIEPVDDNRRLMVEALVSAALRGGFDPAALELALVERLSGCDLSSLEAKAAYVGILRLRGKVTVAEWAVMDYEKVDVKMSESCQVSLYVKGDTIDPEVISEMLGIQPTKAHRKGHVWRTSHGSEIVEKTGLWRLTLQSEGTGVSTLIAEIDRLVQTAGVTVSELPGAEVAFVDVLLLGKGGDDGGGSCEVTLDPDVVQVLGRLGLPVEFTFAAVVP